MKVKLVGCLGVAALALAVPAWSEDSDRTRYYLGLRYGESNPALAAHDVVSLSLGANLNRYVGVELAADFYEFPIDSPDRGRIAELGTGALMPQVRLRYPFLRDRLVPYVIAGAGVALSQVNDTVAPGFTLGGKTGHTAVNPAGTVGGGIEYFVKDNVAFGVEGKYLFSGTETVTGAASSSRVDLSTGLLTFGFRLFYPELHPRPLVDSAGNADSTRFYFGARAGGAIPTHEYVFEGVKARPEGAAYGDTLDQLFGFFLGANFGQHLGLELSLEGYETRLVLPDVGTLGEYAVWAVNLQPRLRYPLRDGRLEPYLVGGVGVDFGDFNDGIQRPDVDVDGDNAGISATLGAGIEYFVTSNIAFDFEAKYLFSRGHSLTINDGPERSGNLDAVLISLAVRVFLFQL